MSKICLDDAQVVSKVHLACEWGDIDVVVALIDVGVLNKAVDDTERSPLQLSVLHPNPWLAMLLIERGVCLKGLYDTGMTAHRHAAIRGCSVGKCSLWVLMWRLLHDGVRGRMKQCTALHMSCENRHLDTTILRYCDSAIALVESMTAYYICLPDDEVMRSE